MRRTSRDTEQEKLETLLTVRERLTLARAVKHELLNLWVVCGGERPWTLETCCHEGPILKIRSVRIFTPDGVGCTIRYAVNRNRLRTVVHGSLGEDERLDDVVRAYESLLGATMSERTVASVCDDCPLLTRFRDPNACARPTAAGERNDGSDSVGARRQ